jgi:hypothetical protein
MDFRTNHKTASIEIKILKKLNIEPVSRESFEILIASLKTILVYAKNIESLMKWNAPVLANLSKLNSEEIDFITSEIQRTQLSIKDCQIKVQRILPQDKRKQFAVYYTTQQGTKFMASVVKEFLCSMEKNIVIADPFLGSGSTLSTTIQTIGSKRIKKVWGIEPLPLPALVAYAAILQSIDGNKEAITVINGDSFMIIPQLFSPSTQPELPNPDIILTNPPFTRWKYLPQTYRKKLISIIEGLGYRKYITRKEVSLHTLSMFLCDYILNTRGFLIAVLPASTFYTIYGRGYKSLLRERYQVLALVENDSKASFSDDSGFKEIIVVASKGLNKNSTAIVKLNNDIEEAVSKIMNNKAHAVVDLHALPQFLDINWLVLFEESNIQKFIVDILKHGLEKGTLGYWNKVLGKESIIRGIEMYGPEFFFLPNKYWSIIEVSQNTVKIENNGKKLNIPCDYLVHILRKPGLYNYKIEADINTYMLAIPPVEVSKLQEDLQKYIRWGVYSDTARPAINAYRKFWYSHVHKQINTKEPFGHVFIPDKVDLLFKNRGVFVNYTRKRIAASKNFYIVRTDNDTSSKLLVGWFNSTFFILVLVLLGRRISETWTRLLENDYLELPVINLNRKDHKTASEVVTQVENVLTKHLPPLWDQLDKEDRYRLDIAIARFIGIENAESTVKKLYQLISNRLYQT